MGFKKNRISTARAKLLGKRKAKKKNVPKTLLDTLGCGKAVPPSRLLAAS